MILFLIKSLEYSRDGTRGLRTKWLPGCLASLTGSVFSYSPDPPGPRLTSGFHGMRISVAWVEDGRLYGFSQPDTHGPLVLTRVGDPSYVNEAIDKWLQVQETLFELNSIPDPWERVAQAVAYARVHPRHTSSVAEIVASSGAAALPGLRQMLKDASLEGHRRFVVQYLNNVAAPEAGPDLVNVLREELTFWRETAPGLNIGWWNEGTGEDGRALYNHYDLALRTLHRLEGFVACKDQVTEFRDFWRSLPQLEDTSGLTQMSDACDRVLDSLRHEPTPRVRYTWGLKRAASLSDPTERAQALMRFLDVGDHKAQKLAWNSLSLCGGPAVPLLSSILNDEKQSLYHAAAVKHLAKAGGPPVAVDIAQLISDEMVFWTQNTIFESVPDWNSLPPEIRARFAILDQALWALEWLDYPDATDEVAAVRDHWKDLPYPWGLETSRIMKRSGEYLKKYAPEEMRPVDFLD